MGKIIIFGFLRRNRGYWAGLMVLTMAFTGALSVLLCGNRLFQVKWKEFLESQEIPGLVLQGKEEEAEEVETWLDDHEGIGWVCVAECQETGKVNEEEKTIFVRSCLKRSGEETWPELEDKSGVSPYYHRWFGGKESYRLDFQGKSTELFVAEPSLLFLGAYQWEQIPSADDSYCEVLLTKQQYEQLLGTSKDRRWYVGGETEELETIKEESKLRTDVSCRWYKDTERFANAREMSGTLNRLTSLFVPLFAAGQWFCLAALSLAVRSVRRGIDAAYEKMGIKKGMIRLCYGVFLGSAVMAGILAGYGAGTSVGINLAEEGLSRLGILWNRRMEEGGMGEILILETGIVCRTLWIPVLAVLPAIWDESAALLRMSSLSALLVSAVVMTIALSYEASREKIMDHLFEERYHYRQQVLFNGFLEREQAQKKMEEAGAEKYEFMAGLSATVKKEDRQAEVWVMALEPEGRAVKMWDEKGNEISLTQNQVVISSRTARELQAEKGDILSYEVSAGGRKVRGSCMVEAVSEQYSQFAEYLRLDDVAGFLQSTGVVGGCFLMEETKHLEDVRYFGDTESQRLGMEESFRSVKGISILCCGASVITGGLMSLFFCQSLIDSHRKSCRYLYYLGQNRWEIVGFLAGQGLAWLLVIPIAGIMAGSGVSILFLRQLSSVKFLYPINLGGRPQITAAAVLTVMVIAAFFKEMRE